MTHGDARPARRRGAPVTTPGHRGADGRARDHVTRVTWPPAVASAGRPCVQLIGGRGSVPNDRQRDRIGGPSSELGAHQSALPSLSASVRRREGQFVECPRQER